MNSFARQSLSLTCVIALSIFVGTSFCLAGPSSGDKSDKSGGKDKIIIPAQNYHAEAASDESRKGRKQFAMNHCAACHSIADHGGCLAPPLDGIGARRSRSFIMARITDDQWARDAFIKFHPSPELLEHPRLPASKTKEIVAYLLTVPEPAHGYTVIGHKLKKGTAAATASGNVPESGLNVNDAQGTGLNLKSGPLVTRPDLVLPPKAKLRDVAVGRALFYDRGCSACHSIGGLGGRFGPALDGVGARRGREHVSGQITGAEFMTNNAQDEYQDRGNVMPPSNLSDKEIEQVTTFLMTVPPGKAQ